MISNNPDIAQSYNKTQTLKKFLTPGWTQIFLYLVVSIFLFIFFNSNQIWSDLSSTILLPQHGIHDLVIPGSAIDGLWQSVAKSRLPLILFWAIIGCLIYTFIWFIKSILTNLQNDMVADLYTHPSNYNRSAFWAKVIGHKILFVIAVGVTILYIFASFVALPLIAHQAYYSIKFYSSLSDVLQILIAIAGLMIMIHIFILLVHMTVNMWKIIYKDL